MSISSELERIMAGKSELATAIEEKGVDVPEGTKIDEMPALVRSITGGGGGNADWNAAEGEPGHVLNRTHYVEQGEKKVVFPEFSGEVAEDGCVYPPALCEYYPSAGETCVVVYNGVTYMCAAFPMNYSYVAEGAEVMAVGNLAAMGAGDDTGEPFCVMICNEAAASEMGMYGGVIVLDGSTTVTASVKCASVAYHKIDPRFVHSPDWNAVEGAAGHVLNRTHYTEEKWLLEETTLTAEDNIAVITELPVPGETYIVNWNGTAHECLCFEFGGYPLLGNGDDGGSGFPFTMMFMDVGMKAVSITPEDGSTTFTVSIKPPDIVRQLDEKYIPVKKPYYVEYERLALGTREEKAAYFAEIAARVETGETVVLRMKNDEIGFVMLYPLATFCRSDGIGYITFSCASINEDFVETEYHCLHSVGTYTTVKTKVPVTTE